MNPFRRLLDFVRNPSNSRTVGVLAVLVIALAIPLTVNIAQKQQELRQQAAGNCYTDRCLFVDYASVPGNVPNCTPTGKSCTAPEDPTKQAAVYSCWEQSACTAATPAPTAPPASCPRAGLQTCSYDPAHPRITRPVNCTPDELTKAVTLCGGKQPVSCQAAQECQSDNCWYDDGTPYPVCPTPTPAACPASGGFTGESCPQGSQAKSNPTPCTVACSNGQTLTGHSTMGCNISGTSWCWYDAYLSPNVSNKSQYCYDNSTNSPIQCPSSTPTPSASPGQTRGPCTKPSNPNAYACTALLNTCNVTSGTRQAYLDLLDDGSSNCNPQTAPYYPCTAPAPISNCPAPNTCNSSNQCVTPAGSAAPTATPTPTPGANNISVNLTVGLDGIGAVGNLSAANSRSNQNPKTTSRSFQIQIYNEDQNHIIALNITPVTLTFNSSGRYTGNWTPPVAGGNYKFRIGTYGHLFKLTPAQTITVGQTPTPTVQIDLPAGDLDNNNAVGTNDYALLGNCAFQPATQSGVCQAADLDDTGTIDLSDLNLLRRNFSMSGDN